MKVLLLNSSAHTNGCTYTALKTVADSLEKQGIETEIFQTGAQAIGDCVACLQCRKHPGRCAFDTDCVNRFIEKAQEADGFVFGTPIYYAHPSGRILCLLDRAFYANTQAFSHKPAAAVACARRAGTTAGLDVLNKYFTIAQMPVVSSTYWNMVHGNKPEDVLCDQEGLQTMENLANNMVWLLRAIHLAEKNGILKPENTKSVRTNFIR